MPLNFTVFGKNFNLLLKPNEKLLLEYDTEIWKRVKPEVLKKVDYSEKKQHYCFYGHQDSFSSAAVSICKDEGSMVSF